MYLYFLQFSIRYFDPLFFLSDFFLFFIFVLCGSATRVRLHRLVLPRLASLRTDQAGMAAIPRIPARSAEQPRRGAPHAHDKYKHGCNRA
jgi:hypothetical protein